MNNAIGGKPIKKNHMKTNNLFKAIPEKLDKEIFESLVESEQVKIERIISKGHTSPDNGWYDQNQNEWIVVLKGAATLLFENGGEKQLTAGDYMNIPARTKHKVSWTDPDDETVWLAVHY